MNTVPEKPAQQVLSQDLAPACSTAIDNDAEHGACS
jgi:hypothetical protein